MPEKNASNAANPPADAPMPTMGKPAFGRTANSVPAAGTASNGGFDGVSGSAFSSDRGWGFEAGFLLFLTTIRLPYTAQGVRSIL
jgi:hypothetical protein